MKKILVSVSSAHIEKGIRGYCPVALALNEELRRAFPKLPTACCVLVSHHANWAMHSTSPGAIQTEEGYYLTGSLPPHVRHMINIYDSTGTMKPFIFTIELTKTN